MQQLFKVTENNLEAQDALYWNRANEKEFENILKDLIARYDSVQVDMTKCAFVSSSYVSILVAYHFFALMRQVRLNIKISSRHQKHFSMANGNTTLNLEVVPASVPDVTTTPV